MIKIDPEALGNLHNEVARAQSSIAHGLSSFAGASPAGGYRVGLLAILPPSGGVNCPAPSEGTATPFGSTSAGAKLNSAYGTLFEVAVDTLKAFAGTVDSDAERLQLALKLYELMERGNVAGLNDVADIERILGSGRNELDIFSTHISTDGEDGELDPQRAKQIETLRNLIGDPTHGNAVINGDFNTNARVDSKSLTEINKFTEQGVDPYAGNIGDGMGGTSASHLPIDYVMPRGVGTTGAERWPGGESDHDGQQVEVNLPNW